MPRCRDLAIFVVTTDRRTDGRTDNFTPAHARGVINMISRAVLFADGAIVLSKSITRYCVHIHTYMDDTMRTAITNDVSIHTNSS